MQVLDFSEFETGKVLITIYTTPEFVPAMKKAIAIAADTGGITSHAAIVSCELSVPCVHCRRQNRDENAKRRRLGRSQRRARNRAHKPESAKPFFGIRRAKYGFIYILMYIYYMKKRLVSLSDEGDARLERLAREKYRNEKGAISKTVEKALEELDKDDRQRTAIRKLIEFAKQNRKLGIGKFERHMAYQGKRFS